MAGRKREKESYIFRSRKTIIAKRIAFAALIVLLIPGGYFIAKQVREGNVFPKKQESSSISSAPSSLTEESGSPQNSESSEPDFKETTDKSYFAFYLPFEKIKDSDVLNTELEKAKSVGLNAVVFDLKDTEGTLLYASETEMVLQTSSVISPAALPAEEVRDIIAAIKSSGFTPIPRIFTFKDHKASWELHSAKVTLDTEPAVTWLDNSPANGGKPWLNPCSPDAHRYISDIAAEISSLGAEIIMLDGIQFPLQTSRANYGDDEMANLPKSEVLKSFVKNVEEKVSAGCEIIVSFPVQTNNKDTAATANYIDTYGDPAAFGGAYASPSLLLSRIGNRIMLGEKTVENPRQNIVEAVNTVASHLGLRIDVMEKPRPALMPWLEVAGYSQEEITQQISALREARDADVSMIFYDLSGNYDFDKINIAP